MPDPPDGRDKATDADHTPNRPPHTNAEIMKAVAHHEPDDSDERAGPGDDLPAAPRSVLQPFVEAIARDDPLPSPRPPADKQAAVTEVRLLNRACTAACLLALKIRPDLDPDSLARLATDDLHNRRRAAFVEDIVLAISVPSTDQTRIARADPAQVINGFIETIVLVSRIVAEEIGAPADEIVRVCFAGADGSIGPPE